MNAVTLSDSFKLKEWVRFMKGQPPEYRVKCLQAVLRCDGKQMLVKCLHELGWTQSIDMISEVERDST